MSVRLNVRRLFKIFLLIKSNPIETCFILSLILGILGPLRCPTFRGYPYLNLPEIKDDLQMCLVTRRPHEFKLCPLVSRDPGIIYFLDVDYCVYFYELCVRYIYVLLIISFLSSYSKHLIKFIYFVFV